MEAVFLFGLFILLLMLSVPIGYAIGMVTLVTMLHFTSMPTLMIAQNSIAGVDSFPLLAIPFFMLAGNLMSGGGIAKRLVNGMSLQSNPLPTNCGFQEHRSKMQLASSKVRILLRS